MKSAICVVLLVGVFACGQDLAERSDRSPSNALSGVVNWSATGTELDPSPVSGGRFGQSVSTSNNWIAAARAGTSPLDPGRTELWQNISGVWTHKFTWRTDWQHHPVAVLSPNWLVIGEPCLSPSSPSTCQARVLTFIWNGVTWVQIVQSITTSSDVWDYGSAIALRDVSGSGASAVSTLAIAGSGVVNVYSLQPGLIVNTHTLTEPSTLYLGSGFGRAVAVTSDGVAVSAPTGIRSARSTGTGFSPGYVYDFNLTTGAVTRLTGVGTEGANAQAFGASLSASVDGRSIAVGAASEVGRSLTAYVFRPGKTGAWSLSNAILAPSGASGTSISVAIDGSLAVMTNEAGSVSRGLLRLFEVPLPPFGATLDASFDFGEASAPLDLRAGHVIVGQPSFSANTGYVATYAESAPVISAAP